jgi:NDP-sugar pyrophosphorylase family protein
MKAAIIAAGLGERLAQAVALPKPLVPINGEPMIARIIRAAARTGAASVACMVNDLSPAVEDYLRAGGWPAPLEIVVKTTPGSLESLFTLSPLLVGEPFLLFTVDAVFPFAALEGFFGAARSMDQAYGVLALTSWMDDEKPLWVKTDRSHRIVAMGEAAGPCDYVTAGFYYLSPRIFSLMGRARQKKLTALRQFLVLLTETGYPIYGLPVSRTIDVDYPEDIEKAENLLREAGEM